MDFVAEIDLDVFQSILDSLPLGVYVLDHERKILWVNKRVGRRFKKDNITATTHKPCYSEVLERRKPCNDCPALKTLKTGKREFTELKINYRGETKHYFITATPLRTGRKGSLPYIIETVQDITRPKQVEEEIRRLNDFNEAIIDHAPVAIFTLDKKGNFTSVNPALAELSGLKERAGEKLVGFNWLKNPYTINCGLADYMKRGLEGKAFQLRDFPFVTYRGDRNQYLNFNGVPLRGRDGKVEGLLCIIEETTEMVRTRAQLLQEAKMSVIGRLATGVAHELNNPLATVTAHSELASDVLQRIGTGPLKESDLEELKEYLTIIEENAFRCTKIIRKLLSLKRKDTFESKNINIAEVIDGLMELINFPTLKIKFIKDVPPGLPGVDGDPEALRQAFLNVMGNAVDAVQGKPNATIWLKARGDGGRLFIQIEDNGVGIPDNMADLIFEPFFTTKEPAKGTGLGLTLAYDFLHRMGGAIEMERRVGGGSIFRISLPLYNDKAQVETSL